MSETKLPPLSGAGPMCKAPPSGETPTKDPKANLRGLDLKAQEAALKPADEAAKRPRTGRRSNVKTVALDPDDMSVASDADLAGPRRAERTADGPNASEAPDHSNDRSPASADDMSPPREAGPRCEPETEGPIATGDRDAREDVSVASATDRSAPYVMPGPMADQVTSTLDAAIRAASEIGLQRQLAVKDVQDDTEDVPAPPNFIERLLSAVLDTVTSVLLTPAAGAVVRLATGAIDGATKQLVPPSAASSAAVGLITRILNPQLSQLAQAALSGRSTQAARMAYREVQDEAIRLGWDQMNALWASQTAVIRAGMQSSPLGLDVASALLATITAAKNAAHTQQYQASLAGWTAVTRERDRSAHTPQGTIVIEIASAEPLSETKVVSQRLERSSSKVEDHRDTLGITLAKLMHEPASTFRVVQGGEVLFETVGGLGGVTKVRPGKGYTFLAARGQHRYRMGSAPDVTAAAAIFTQRDLLPVMPAESRKP